jgi:O-antigen/teichoic acid export membrane protein
MWPTGGKKRREQDLSSHYSREAVRQSLLHFLFGKALNASISILTLVALARWVTPEIYGTFIAFMALQGSMLALSSFGIDSTVERFLPELRTRHADQELLGFVMAAIIIRLASLLLLAVIALLTSDFIASAVGLEQHAGTLRIWVGVIVLTGIHSFAVTLLEAMLHQRLAQRCMSVYVITKVILLSLAHNQANLDLRTLVVTEMLSTGFAAAIGSWSLIRHFPSDGIRSGWQIAVSNRRRMQRFASFNYLAQVVFQFFSTEMMKLLVTRLLGVLQSARYGFACSIAETVQRYLPAVLLVRMIKPVFISRYTKTGDFADLNQLARIILKLNLLVLAPAVAVSAIFGEEILGLLSGGNYTDARWILVGTLLVLALSSHQLVLSLLASTLEKNAMQLYAGLASTIAFPCALFLIPSFGALGAIASSAISGFLYNVLATFYLRRAGYRYQPDLRGAAVFFIAGIVLYCTSRALLAVSHGLPATIASAFAGVCIYVVVVRQLSAFTAKERELLNSVLPKRMFVF